MRETFNEKVRRVEQDLMRGSADFLGAEYASPQHLSNNILDRACRELASGYWASEKGGSMNYAVDDPRLFTWLQNLKVRGAGHFLSAIGEAAFQADGENAKILYPVLKQLQEKYPVYEGDYFTR